MALRETTSPRHPQEDPLQAIEFCYSMGWTDGLPVVPPTDNLVNQFLEYAGLEPSAVVLVEPVAGRVITAEKAAANAIMAGCLKEYFPVVLAALDAMGDPDFNLHGATLNTGGAAVMAIVNGPIVHDIGLNSGVALFCPGNRANATIGRALHLVLWNCTGNRPDQMDQTVLGHAGRYSMCIAERERALPAGWEPLHVERGLSRASSAVTVLTALLPHQAGYMASSDPREILLNVAFAMRALPPSQHELVMVVSPEVLGHLGKAGWSKANVREFLFEEARVLSREVRRGHNFRYIDPPESADEEMLPILDSPDALQIVAGGGDAGAMVMIVPIYGLGLHASSVTRKIKAARKINAD